MKTPPFPGELFTYRKEAGAPVLHLPLNANSNRPATDAYAVPRLTRTRTYRKGPQLLNWPLNEGGRDAVPGGGGSSTALPVSTDAVAGPPDD